MNISCRTITGCQVLLAVLISFCGKPASAQPAPRPVTLYYTASWELTNPDKAVYHRETTLDLRNLEFDGVYKDFTKANKLLAEGYYAHGVRRGLHSAYSEDGSLKSTFEYAENGFIIWELVNDQHEHVVTRGTGKFSTYFYDFQEQDHVFRIHEGIVSGEFISGKRAGTWTYEDIGGVVTDQEVYEHGAFVKRITITKRGAVEHHEKKPVIPSLTALIQEAFNYDTTQYVRLNQYIEQNLPAYDVSFERTITFPEGIKRFLLLMAINLPVARDETIVKLTVDEHGNLKKIKPAFPDSELDYELKQLIQPHQKKFLPAVMEGKPYEYTLRIPISNEPRWITYLQTTTDDDLAAYLAELNQ